MKIRKIPRANLGLGVFQSTRPLFAWVIGIMLLDSIVIGIFTPFLTSTYGAAQLAEHFGEIEGNLGLVLLVIPFAWLLAAFGEELFFRGLLLAAVAETLGASRATRVAAVLLQAIAFGAVHTYRGIAQPVSIAIGGVVYGAAFLLVNSNLWPLVLARGLNDTIGLIFLYTGDLQT